MQFTLVVFWTKNAHWKQTQRMSSNFTTSLPLSDCAGTPFASHAGLMDLSVPYRSMKSLDWIKVLEKLYCL